MRGPLNSSKGVLQISGAQKVDAEKGCKPPTIGTSKSVKAGQQNGQLLLLA